MFECSFIGGSYGHAIFPSPSVIEIVVSYNLQQDIMDRWPKR